MKTLSTLIMLSLTILLGYSVTNYWSLPEVHTDLSGQCIRVINNSDTQYACENMPDKYINYIVKM